MFLPVSQLTLQEFFFKIHFWDAGHIHYKCYKFGCTWSISKGTLHEDLCMCSPVSWLPLEGFSRKFTLHVFVHFSAGIEGLASPCGCLISQHQMDKWLSGYKSQTGCDKSEKSYPCPKSKHGHPASTQTVYDNSNPKMKMTFVPQ
jgi:hypothetical protein